MSRGFVFSTWNQQTFWRHGGGLPCTFPDNLIWHVEFGSTMSSLCTALDLPQNGGITSGSDVFFVVFWTLHVMQSIWWWCLWTRRSNVVFETHLLHARHLQVNLDSCGATLFSWMCMSFVNNNNKPIYFSAKLCFAFFWKLHDVFEKFVNEENVFGVWSYLRMFWKWWWIQLTWIHQCEAECFWCVWNLCDSAAMFKTGQVQEDQHSTVHAAWTANLLCSRRFLCGKELSDWCSESRCFGVLCFLFKHSTWRRPTPLRAFATSGCN